MNKLGMSLPRLAMDATAPLRSPVLTEFSFRMPRYSLALAARNAAREKSTARKTLPLKYASWGKRR